MKLCKGQSTASNPTALYLDLYSQSTGELKERIENLNETIVKTTDMELRRHLSAQLADLTKADIGTMDSFTQKLVTTYGYSLGISPQFRILQDEIEKASLKKRFSISFLQII